jgi:hypothetical protein
MTEWKNVESTVFKSSMLSEINEHSLHGMLDFVLELSDLCDTPNLTDCQFGN